MSKTQNKIPKLRFPEFEGEWKKLKLEKISSKIGSGKTPLGGENVYQKVGISFIRSQNVLNDKLNLDDVKIPLEIHNSMLSSKVLPNDILLNITGGSIGRSCVVPSDFVEGNVNQHVAIIRLIQDNPKFLQSILSSWRGQKLIYEGQTGSGREGLNFESIKSFKIAFPSLPEQHKIATFLTSIDARIQLLERKKAQLETYKKGVMQQLFSQRLRFKQEDGGEFPEWEEKRLGEIGYTFNGLTGKTKEDFGEGKPYVQYMQIFSNSRIKPEEFGLVSINDGENQSLVKYGDVFFTTSSETPKEIGTSSVMLDDVGEVYLNSFCFGYRPKSLDVIIPEFARFLFRSEMFRKKVIPLAQGSTRYNLSKVELMRLSVILPNVNEQRKIASFLSSLDAQIEAVGAQIGESREFKRGLLREMFV